MHSHNHKSKRMYASPKLVVYGDIRELTRNNSYASSMGDNPSLPPTASNNKSAT